MDMGDFILPDRVDKSTVSVSQGKKRKADQPVVKSENFSRMPSESDLTTKSTFGMSSKDQYVFMKAEPNVIKKEPIDNQERSMAEIKDDPLKAEVPIADALWQCLLAKALESKSKDNLNLMRVILVEISTLLGQFNRLVERICQENLSDGGEISIKEYPLIQAVMPKNLQSLQMSNRLSLLSELQVELDIVKKANASLQKKVKKKVRQVKKKDIHQMSVSCNITENETKDSMKMIRNMKLVESENQKRHFSVSQMACEALLQSDERKLDFDHLVHSISTRHNDMKSKGRIQCLRQVLQRNAHFVFSESGTERERKGLHTMFNNEKDLFWSLSEEATEAILHGYNNDPSQIDFCQVKVPFSPSAKKSEIQQLINGSEVNWQPFFLVSKETFSEMRRGLHPIQCPNCGKEYSIKQLRQGRDRLSSIERLVAHWKNNLCDKHMASQVAKEVTGTRYSDKQQRFACTHPDCESNDQTWINVQAVQLHYNLKHKESFKGKLWQCPKCDKDFITEGLRNTHVRAGHDKEKHICKFCGSTFSTKGLRNEHEKHYCLEVSADVTGWVECEFCGQKLRRRSLQSHKKCYHPEKLGFDIDEAKKQNTCKICEKGFPSKSALNTHLLTHGEPKYQCPICHKLIRLFGNYKKHMINAHNQGFTCDFCPKKFFDGIQLKRHQRHAHQNHS